MLIINTENGAVMRQKIEEKQKIVAKLQAEIKRDYMALGNMYISPFKVGDIVMCKLNGKETKGILEMDMPSTLIYIRPYTKEGKVSLQRKMLSFADYCTVVKL